jgi:hypothetical protein
MVAALERQFQESDKPILLPPLSGGGTSEKPLTRLEFRIQFFCPLDHGIIGWLTRQCGGNVHEKGIVILTSKTTPSSPKKALTQVADRNPDWYFCSQNEPDQWVCWDFRERRLLLTHYALRALLLGSWVMEGSLDGENWTEIDRQTDHRAFRDLPETTAFTVSNPAECSFIRLTQTYRNYGGHDVLALGPVEFFGILSQ